MSDNKIQDKIRKLLALAGNNPSEHEAATALAMAHKLMAKHNLSHKDIDIHNAPKVGELIWQGIKTPPHNRTIINAIMKLYDCSWLMMPTQGAIIIGTEQDANVAQEVCAWLIQAINRQNARYNKENFCTGNSFAQGAATKVWLKVKEIQDKTKRELEQEQQGQGTALAVIQDQKKLDQDNYINSTYKLTKPRKSRALAGHNVEAYNAGKQYADGLNLGKQLGN